MTERNENNSNDLRKPDLKETEIPESAVSDTETGPDPASLPSLPDQKAEAEKPAANLKTDSELPAQTSESELHAEPESTDPSAAPVLKAETEETDTEAAEAESAPDESSGKTAETSEADISGPSEAQSESSANPETIPPVIPKDSEEETEQAILDAPVSGAAPEKGNKTLSRLWLSPFWNRVFLAAALAAITIALILGLSLNKMKAELDQREATIAELYNNIHEKDAKIAELNRTIASDEDELKLLRNGPNTMLQKVQSAFAQEKWQDTIDLADQLHELYPGNANDIAAQRLKKKAKAALDAEKKAEAVKKKKQSSDKD